MAPRITKHRIWCKTCNEFTLHSRKELLNDKFPLVCESCQTSYSDIKLSEIPDEKIIEQRNRFKESRRNDINNMFGSYLSLGLLQTFSDSGYEAEIIESDAGQRDIDNEKRQKDLERRNILLQKRHDDLELKKKFHNLGRNEKCLCGSGKKYKKCCWTKINKL